MWSVECPISDDQDQYVKIVSYARTNRLTGGKHPGYTSQQNSPQPDVPDCTSLAAQLMVLPEPTLRGGGAVTLY